MKQVYSWCKRVTGKIRMGDRDAQSGEKRGREKTALERKKWREVGGT